MREIILSNEQLKLINMEPEGFIIVRGIAGSGKTTIAIERFKNLLENYTNENEKIMVLCFTNALNKYMINIFKENDILANQKTNIRAMYGVFKEFLKLNSIYQIPIDEKNSLEYLTPIYEKYKNKYSNSVIFKKNKLFVLDEFQFILSNFCHYHKDNNYSKDLEKNEYFKVKRFNRPIKNFQSIPRSIIWEMLNEYIEILEKNKVMDYSYFYYKSLKLQKKLIEEDKFDLYYKHLIIDEAQDLSKVQLEFLINMTLVKQGIGSIMIIGDIAQRIYKNIYSWKSLGFEAKGNSYILRKNYRNTIQIAKAAEEIIKQDDELLIDDQYIKWEKSDIVNVGSKVVLNHFLHNNSVFENDYSKEERIYICDKIEFLIKKKKYSYSDIVILNYSRKQLQKYCDDLVARNIPVQIINDDKTELNPNCIYLCTMHSVKGLEFPVVFVTGINKRLFGGSDVEDAINENRQKLKLLYMTITRAKKYVYITSYCNLPSPFITPDKIDYSLFAVKEDCQMKPFFYIGTGRKGTRRIKIKEWLHEELKERYGYTEFDSPQNISIGEEFYCVDFVVSVKEVPLIAVKVIKPNTDGVNLDTHLLQYMNIHNTIKYGICTDGNNITFVEKKVEENYFVFREIEDLPSVYKIDAKEIVKNMILRLKN